MVIASKQMRPDQPHVADLSSPQQDASFITSSVRKKRKGASGTGTHAGKRICGKQGTDIHDPKQDKASTKTQQQQGADAQPDTNPHAATTTLDARQDGMQQAEAAVETPSDRSSAPAAQLATEEAATNCAAPPAEATASELHQPCKAGQAALTGTVQCQVTAGSKAKGVLNTIFSPIFTAFVGRTGADNGGEAAPQQQKQMQSVKHTANSHVSSATHLPTTQHPHSVAQGAGANAAMDKALHGLGKQQSSHSHSSDDRQSGSSDHDESDVCTLQEVASTDHDDGAKENDAALAVVAEAYVEPEEDEDEYAEFDPYSFIKGLPPLQQVVPQWRRSLLPRQTRRFARKTLVLDLDETLVHSTLDSFDKVDFTFPVSFNGRQHTVNVRQRPHLFTFLERTAQLFEVVVFTASQKVYAEELLNIMDPDRRLIRHRVFRDSCVLVDGNYLKDLTILGRDMRHTIIVDNSPQAFGFQLTNGIPIESWYDDESDKELLQLLPFLESLVEMEDVRPAIEKTYKLQQLVEQAPCQSMFP